MYRELYPHVFEKIRLTLSKAGRVHGSHIRDFLIEAGQGTACDSGVVESIIAEYPLYPESSTPEPTHSQSAFFSLQRLRVHPGFTPGTKEHFWLTPVAPKAVGLAEEGPNLATLCKQQERAAVAYAFARHLYAEGAPIAYLMQQVAYDRWKDVTV
jgi:hypothetical protein